MALNEYFIASKQTTFAYQVMGCFPRKSVKPILPLNCRNNKAKMATTISHWHREKARGFLWGRGFASLSLRKVPDPVMGLLTSALSIDFALPVFCFFIMLFPISL